MNIHADTSYLKEAIDNKHAIYTVKHIKQ